MLVSGNGKDVLVKHVASGIEGIWETRSKCSAVRLTRKWETFDVC